MPGPQTLIELLEGRALAEPDREAFCFEERAISFGDLWRNLERFAGSLLKAGIECGDRVVLTLPNGPEFFAGFYGVQRAGAVAVPLFPDSGAERVFGIARVSGARTVVFPSSLDEADFEEKKGRGAERGLSVLTPFSEGPPPEAAGFPAIEPADLAYIQYTSGSTGEPKGVQLSHANLLTNMRQLISGMEITENDIFVSWLPAYHDMGLVLMTMVPFFLGARLVLLPASLGQVRRWLTEIDRHRATFTAAPDFAYRLCLRYAGDPRQYDLSSLRVALNAAEPVRSGTIRDFEAAFGLENVMMPGYGLAEATVGVSMSPPGRPVPVDRRGFVSVGPPFPEIEVEILREGRRAQPGEEGEVLVKSPANTRGYWDDPASTAELFSETGFLRTGDIGYLDDEGNLYIVGRQKNIIIQAGRNIAPKEVEEIVDTLPFVRYSAAVGIDRGGSEGEQLYAFVEMREGRPKEDGERRGAGLPPRSELKRRTVSVVQQIRAHLGLRPGRVYLLAPRSIPLTPNGKIRYPELRWLYLNGRLREQGDLLYPDW
jgi:acyl-CoA synthetase (AMP-forming)/AMP-acid ligase II